ncbi:MAG: dTDP-4-dehydrorhamnose 3,5-epimerase family protein [Ignavibacteriaceae bacterium]
MGVIKIIDTKLFGVKIIESSLFRDERGVFSKHFQKSKLVEVGINFKIEENFFSISKKGVIRGLHFQKAPYSQKKLVYCPFGAIFDIVLDLRIDSPTYQSHIIYKLSDSNNRAIYIPKGCAHGFQSLKNNSITVYLQSNEYSPESDSGVSPLSLNIKWPIKKYTISKKDHQLESYLNYSSSFKITDT